MAVVDTQPRPGTRWDPGFAYLMTGIALGCIWVSYVVGAIWGPEMITGSQHQHFNSAAGIGWIFNGLATAMVMTAALRGIRAKTTDKAPWMMLGLGSAAIWLAVMLVAVFAPPWVTGTDPDTIPFWAGLAAIMGVILTWVLCQFVRTASFESPPNAGSVSSEPTVGVGSIGLDTTVKLRQLAQLHDSGVITDAEFETKKGELLTRI